MQGQKRYPKTRLGEFIIEEVHNYAVTATQKSILKAFDLAETNIRKQAAGINEDLKSYNMKEVLNNVLSGSERS